MDFASAYAGRRAGGFARSLPLLAIVLALSLLPAARAQDAASLRARFAELREQLASNRFERPLVLMSKQSSNVLTGDIYAIVAEPFAGVSKAFLQTAPWCDILILHINVKNCRLRGGGGVTGLNVAIGRKWDQPMQDAYLVDFNYRVTADERDYMGVLLSADQGPLTTRDYRIVLEAVALDERRSFVHLSYSYGYGMAARTALQLYLSTIGRDKVGFSIVGRESDGAPVYVADLRGLLERNTMRYFLAIEAYLASLALPEHQQLNRRLNDWFIAVERYPRQLHEMNQDEYLAMKRREVARQKSAPRLD